MTCKPTGNFAENLDLGKHVLPNPDLLGKYFYTTEIVIHSHDKKLYLHVFNIVEYTAMWPSLCF